MISVESKMTKHFSIGDSLLVSRTDENAETHRRTYQQHSYEETLARLAMDVHTFGNGIRLLCIASRM